MIEDYLKNAMLNSGLRFNLNQISLRYFKYLFHRYRKFLYLFAMKYKKNQMQKKSEKNVLQIKIQETKLISKFFSQKKIILLVNKAGYTATSCRWVSRGGNVSFLTFQLHHYGPIDQWMDRPMDGPINGWTDKVSQSVSATKDYHIFFKLKKKYSRFTI